MHVASGALSRGHDCRHRAVEEFCTPSPLGELITSRLMLGPWTTVVAGLGRQQARACWSAAGAPGGLHAFLLAVSA